MKKIILKISAGFLILVVGALAVICGYGWFTAKQARVANGVARSSFPYGDYNADELNAMYPQVANENVATTQTPEQTYVKFISAVKAGDFDGAVKCCFRQGDQEKMKAGLEEIQRKGQMGQMLTDLGGGIKEEFVGDTKASYSYTVVDNGQKYAKAISFVKDIRGVWLIESL